MFVKLSIEFLKFYKTFVLVLSYSDDLVSLNSKPKFPANAFQLCGLPTSKDYFYLLKRNYMYGCLTLDAHKKDAAYSVYF